MESQKMNISKKSLDKKRLTNLFASDTTTANAHASSLLYRTFLTKEYFPLLRGKYDQLKLQVPTHIFIGENDPVIHPLLFKNFQNGENNMTLEVLPHCGHFIPEEQPELIAKKISVILKK